MNLYSIELKLAGRKCLVAGGGEVAERKVAALRDCGAQVSVVAPELAPGLRALADAGEIEHLARGFEPNDLAEAALCIAATDERSVNEAVFREASARSIPVNIVDQPDLCSFFVPATIKRGPISVALSTTGASPALARRLREQLEGVVTPAHGELAGLMGKLRDEVRQVVPEEADRRRIYREMLDSDALTLLAEGKHDEAEEVLRACMC